MTAVIAVIAIGAYPLRGRREARHDGWMTTTADGRTIELSRDDEDARYAARIDGALIGEADFVLSPGLVVFTHTIIDPALEGQGIGTALVRFALDDVRASGVLALPYCPFVRAFVKRHADEYGDLVYRPPAGAAEGF